MPQMVRYVGMAHGLLFVLYAILLLMVWKEYRWKFAKVLMAFVASLVPFGTFWFDMKLQKEQ